MRKIFLITVFILLIGCTQEIVDNNGDLPDDSKPIGMANPASVYCLEQGGELNLNWSQMNTIANTYQSIITKAVSKGWGGEVFPYLSVETKFGPFGIELKVGYQLQFQPDLEISKKSSYDPERVDKNGKLTGKVEESTSTINNDTVGIAGTIMFNYRL